MSTISITVIKNSHANLDSLPLRFGMHFRANHVLNLEVIQDLGRDPGYPDRFHIIAKFKNPSIESAIENEGHFVLAQNPQDPIPVLVTVWRGDRDVEWGLSNTVRALRKDGFLSVTNLLEMHPLYVQGQVTDSPGLLKYMSSNIARADIERFQRVAEEARAETARLIKNLEISREEAEMARNKAERMKSVAQEAITAVEGLEDQHIKHKTKISQLEETIKMNEAKYQEEIAAAKRDRSVATLSAPDTLIEVKEQEMIRGSLCTVLILADGTRRHMKTATFDKDGSVTRRAKEMIGKRVRTTCWDPISVPGKWSSQGYFRNIYETK